LDYGWNYQDWIWIAKLDSPLISNWETIYCYLQAATIRANSQVCSGQPQNLNRGGLMQVVTRLQIWTMHINFIYCKLTLLPTSDVPELSLSSQSNKPFESESSKIFSSQTRVMTWSSRVRVTRTDKSLRVVGLQARVTLHVRVGIF